MLKSLLRDRHFLILLSLAILVKLFSLNESWVERYYTYGIYPFLSRLLRMLLGWIPFSVGDLLYIASFAFLVWKAWKLIHLLAKRKVKEYLSWILFRKYLKLVLWIYLVFNIFWGLNYNRQGIAWQLGLNVQPYNATDLSRLASTLQLRLNQYAMNVDSLRRMELDENRVLFSEGENTYEKIRRQYPFLDYRNPCVKPSLFSHI